MTFIIFSPLPGNDLRSEKERRRCYLSAITRGMGGIFFHSSFFLVFLLAERFMISYKWGMSRALKICHHDKYVSTLSYSSLPSLRPIAAATAFHISYLYNNLYEDFYYISAPHMHRGRYAVDDAGEICIILCFRSPPRPARNITG